MTAELRELFERGRWQMTAGERAALEGVLRVIAPRLAIEIGTAEGGSLRCVARHAEEVHSFDLVAPPADVAELPNVTVHTGDSHALLRETLRAFEADGRSIDFALVDGDHTAPGVRADVEDLLGSSAVTDCVILLHDTANEEVRAGLEAVDYTVPKVAAADLDFVPGYLVRGDRGGAFRHEIWGGLGLILVGERGERELELVSGIAYSAAALLEQSRQHLVSDDEPLRARNAELERRLTEITESQSWRLTAPLRGVAARLRAFRA